MKIGTFLKCLTFNCVYEKKYARPLGWKDLTVGGWRGGVFGKEGRGRGFRTPLKSTKFTKQIRNSHIPPPPPEWGISGPAAHVNSWLKNFCNILFLNYMYLSVYFF